MLPHSFSLGLTLVIFFAAAQNIHAKAILPYYCTDFRADDGYVTGSLSGQDGWRLECGVATVQKTSGLAESFNVKLEQGVPATSITQELDAACGDVIYIDLWLRPVASTNPNSATKIVTNIFRLSLIKDANMGRFCLNGDSMATDGWRKTNCWVPLNKANQSVNWIEYTICLNYVTTTYDLYINKMMIVAAEPFPDIYIEGLPYFTIEGAADAASYLGDVYIGSESPLDGPHE